MRAEEGFEGFWRECAERLDQNDAYGGVRGGGRGGEAGR